MKTRFSRTGLILIGVFALFFSATVKAENLIQVTEPSDFWFSYETPTSFNARTYAVDSVHSDPMLWLYDFNDNLIASNDDWFGLQSNIDITLDPGVYRLRTGVCCGDPNRWWPGVIYNLATNTSPSATTTTSSTIETWESTTTTTEQTPTTVTSIPSSPTSSSTTTTQPDPTTTTSILILPPSTTSTVPSTTTTETVLNTSTTSTTLSATSLTPSPTTVPLPISPTTTISVSTTQPRLSSSTTTMNAPTTTVMSATEPPTTQDLSSSTSTVPAETPTRSLKTEKTYVQKVGIGPIKFTIKVTESERRTVIAAAIVQITAVASISTISSGGTTPRRNR